MSRLKTELQLLRKRAALKTSDDGQGTPSSHAAPERDNSRSCVRCKIGLGRIINRGALCKSCRQRVCKACREYNLRGTDWVCTACYKNATVEIASEEWMNPLIRRPSRRRHSKEGVLAGDIVARGIRRSWTISNPSSSKEEPLSPELRVYNTLVTPVRKSDDTGDHRIGTSPDENRPPLPPLLWEPRDPPLQYSGIPSYENRPSTERMHRRVEPRRSASLSQADHVLFEGKMLPRLQSRSPVRPTKIFMGQPPKEARDPAAQYEEYYETKYEKPVRRLYNPQAPKAEDVAAVTAAKFQPAKYESNRSDKTGWRSQSDDRLRTAAKVSSPAASKGTPNADAAALKSRWRSVSPPPPLTDDWVPIKPPQLAWAKTLPIESIERSDERRRGNRSKEEQTRRSKIPVMQIPIIPRSVSGDMIYLERESSDVLRERTLSIDRGIASPNSKGQADRMVYKTYEEELRDYQGRTGSVDRLANRGRPRTAIRMGTLSHAGRSVPSSLERRHSEVGSKERRRDDSIGSSAHQSVAKSSRKSSGSAAETSSTGTNNSSEHARQGTSTTDTLMNEPARDRDSGRNRLDQRPQGPSAQPTTRNVNRVYIDGSTHDSQTQRVGRIQSSKQGSNQIRITMTDTRSLKRPPKQGVNQVQQESVKVQPIETPQATTLPRMNKRSNANPGSTTVYLTTPSPDASGQIETIPSSQMHQIVNKLPFKSHDVYETNSATLSTASRTKTTSKRLKIDEPNNLDSGISKNESTRDQWREPPANGSTRTLERKPRSASTKSQTPSERDPGRGLHDTHTGIPIYVGHFNLNEHVNDISDSNQMQDACVQTSDLFSDDYRSDFLDTTNEDIGSGGSVADGAGKADRSSSHLEESRSGIQLEGSSNGAPYHNHSDTASDIVLDTNKIVPEGDDYKIVFISSDSSKSSLEDSFETSDRSPFHSRHPSSVHDSETTGFIDESDWDFFASRGLSSPSNRNKHQRHHHHHLQQLRQPTPQSPQSQGSRSSSADESRIFADSNSSSRLRKAKAASHASGNERTPTFTSVNHNGNNQRTFQVDDYKYAWAESPFADSKQPGHNNSMATEAPSSFERHVRSASGSSAASMEDLRRVTYTNRQVQTDFCSVDDFVETCQDRNDYSPTRSIEEWESSSHIRTNPSTPRAHLRPSMNADKQQQQHFIPIWQVPSSSRSSNHSLHSLLVNTSGTDGPEPFGRVLDLETSGPMKHDDENIGIDPRLIPTSDLVRHHTKDDRDRIDDDQDGRQNPNYVEYGMDYGDRNIPGLNAIDRRILSQSNLISEGMNGGSFISSLYSPEGQALPGFQEYRQQILTEIQAYTAKGDWNLVATSDVSCMHTAESFLGHSDRYPPGTVLDEMGSKRTSSVFLNSSGVPENTNENIHYGTTFSDIHDNSWSAVVELARKSTCAISRSNLGNYRVRSTGSRPPSSAATKRWRSDDASTESVENTRSATAAGDDHGNNQQGQHFHWAVPGDSEVQSVSAISQAGDGECVNSSVKPSRTNTKQSACLLPTEAKKKIQVNSLATSQLCEPASPQSFKQTSGKQAGGLNQNISSPTSSPLGFCVPTNIERDSNRDSHALQTHQIGTKKVVMKNSIDPKKDQTHDGSQPTTPGAHSNNSDLSEGRASATGDSTGSQSVFASNNRLAEAKQKSSERSAREHTHREEAGREGQCATKLTEPRASGNCPELGSLKETTRRPPPFDSTTIEKRTLFSKAQHATSKEENGQNDKLPSVSKPAATSSLGAASAGQSVGAAHSSASSAASTSLAAHTHRDSHLVHSSGAALGTRIPTLLHPNRLKSAQERKPNSPAHQHIDSSRPVVHKANDDIGQLHLHVEIAKSCEPSQHNFMESKGRTCTEETNVAPSADENRASRTDDREEDMAESGGNVNRVPSASGVASSKENVGLEASQNESGNAEPNAAVPQTKGHEKQPTQKQSHHFTRRKKSDSPSGGQIDSGSVAIQEAGQIVSRHSHASDCPPNKTMEKEAVPLSNGACARPALLKALLTSSTSAAGESRAEPCPTADQTDRISCSPAAKQPTDISLDQGTSCSQPFSSPDFPHLSSDHSNQVESVLQQCKPLPSDSHLADELKSVETNEAAVANEKCFVSSEEQVALLALNQVDLPVSPNSCDQNEPQLTPPGEMTASEKDANVSHTTISSDSPNELEASLNPNIESAVVSSEAVKQFYGNTRFEVSSSESPDLRSNPQTQRRLLSDSDVPTSGDEGDSAISFDTDSQQDTVIEGHSTSYQDLRQFALKQSLRKDTSLSPTPTALSGNSDVNEQSDTDSSSSRTDGSLSRRTGSSTSPVPSEGRLTPRRSQGQYTSYVLITREASKLQVSPSDQVISDDESGVTVTVPQPAASATGRSGEGEGTASPPVVCVVEVPARESPRWKTNSPPNVSEEKGPSDSEAQDNSEANEEGTASCVTVSGNGVLTDHDIEEDTTTDNDFEDENTPTEQVENASKLAKYFTYALESADYSSRRKQPVVYRNTDCLRSSSPDPFREETDLSIAEADSAMVVPSDDVEDDSFASNDEPTADLSSLEVTEQDTVHYESDPSERLDSIDDGESNYSESVSSGDEAYFDREEELRGYNRAIDFTLHTILEESCEESDGERRSRTEHKGLMKSSEPSELEKYFTFGLGGVTSDAPEGGKQRRTSFANEESEYSDTFSETSSSIYSEGLESVERSAGEEDDIDPVELASSRLEKYFMTNFLGLEGGQYAFPVATRPDQSPGSDGSESVGSDSEGHPSPEQRRRKVMVKTRQGRSQRQSSTTESWNRHFDRKESAGNEMPACDLSESNQDKQQEGDSVDPRYRSGSSSNSGSDMSSEEVDETAFEKTDGQFDTIKRRKKKRSAGDHEHERLERQEKMAVIEDKISSLSAPASANAETNSTAAAEKMNEPSPLETAEAKNESPVGAQNNPSEDLAAGLDPNSPRKYQSRDSGFVGSCDDLLNESSSQREVRKRISSESGSDGDGDKSNAGLQPARPNQDLHDASNLNVVKADEGDTKSGKSVGSSGSSGEHCGSLTSTSQSSKTGKLSRKDSFNNWSSDEETNLMMNKMRAFFRNMVSTSATKGDSENGERIKPPQLVAFENELTRLMKSVPGINDQQVKEIVEYLSSEDTWSDSYDSSDYTSSDLEGAYAVLDPALPQLNEKSELQQQISASCQEIIEKFDLDRSPEGSRQHMESVGAIPWIPVGEDASNSLTKETAFVYQRLVNSLMRLSTGPKTVTEMANNQNQAKDASNDLNVDRSNNTPHSSPPMIAKVLHHIGNRLVALMHEVSASSDTTSHSGSIDDDAQSASRMKEMRLAAHFEPVTSSPRVTKMNRLFLTKDHLNSADDKRSLSTSVDSEDTPTDTEQSPDSDDGRTRDRKKIGAGSDGAGIKYGFESLHTYEKRMSSLPVHLGNSAGSGEVRNRSEERESRGFSSLETAEPSRGVIGGSRSLKARLAERARTLEAERRRHQAEDKRLVEEDHAADDDAVDEDRFYKKERKLPRFSVFRTTRETREALQSSSSGVSDIAEEKEDEFSGWRSSFESAIAADSRTKLSLEAKRRSAGSASSSELFASSELLDRDPRRVRSTGHSSKFSLPNLLERDAVRMAKERERERSASSDVLLSTSPIASNTMLSVIDQQEDEDAGWDRLVITRMSSKRRSSVPDTREDRGAEREEPRSTTLPRSTTALNAVENDLNIDVLGSSSPSISASTAGVKKSLSLLLSNSSTCNSASESSLNTSVDAPVKSARYRPPGFRPTPVESTPRDQSKPSRVSSAGTIGLQTNPTVTPRLGASISGRKTVRSLLADEGKDVSSSPSFVREGLRTSVASAASGESFSSVSVADTNDENEPTATASKSRSSSLSALGNRSDSMASVYSAAGEARYGTVAVRGEVQFGLHYNYRQTTLEVFVKQCKDLAPVDTKRNRSDPYAKVYLLPDRSRSGKRKTKVKKHTLCPVFEENLKFTATLSDLENRTLWLTVWHSDMFGRNDFLGEVTLPLAGRIFDDPTPHWYQLQERSEQLEDATQQPIHRGDMIVAVKYVPSDSLASKKTKKSKGALHVLVKEAKGLVASRPNGNIDALCKGTLLPEKGKTTKHKTIISRRTSNPVWNSTLVFDDVSHQELAERSLELSVWNHDRLASKEFLGGLRFNLGTGLHQGKPVDWMDAVGKEVTLWQSVIERAGLWFEGSLPLRTTMEEPVAE